MVKEKHLIFLDTETTGLNPDVHEIIELAWIITDLNLNKKSGHCYKINPENIENADYKALEINGYSKEVWNKEAIPLEKALREITKSIPFGERAIVIGHNVDFDLRFLRKAFKDLGVFCSLSYHRVDTLSLSVAYKIAGRGIVKESENFKLKTMADILEVDHKNTHTAMSDTEAVYEIFKELSGLMRLGLEP